MSRFNSTPAALLAVCVGISVALGAGVFAWRKSRAPSSPPNNIGDAKPRNPASAKTTAIQTDDVTLSSPSKRSSAEFRQQAELLFNEAPSEERVIRLRELVSAWAKVAPQECIQFIESLSKNPARVALGRVAMAVWLKEDERTAKSYILRGVNADVQNSKYYLVPLFDHEWEKGGYPALSAIVNLLPTDENVFAELTRPVAGAINQTGATADTMLFIESIKNDAVRQKFLEMTGVVLAREFGSEILSEADYAKMREIVPKGAMTGVLGQLMTSDPEATFKWLQNQPLNADLDVARYRAVQKQYSSDPKGATEMAALISDNEIRNGALRMALSAWAAVDHEAAETWAIGSVIEPEQLVGPLSSGILTSSPGYFENKINEVAQINDPVKRDRAVYHYYLSWYSINPRAAKNWLVQSNLSPALKTGLSLLGGPTTP